MNKLMKALLMVLLISTVAFAQNAPIDFETGGHGASWTWTVFENGTNPAVEIVANPDASGINTSSTVAKFSALSAGQAWAGTESQHGSDIGTFTLDSTNSTIKIMVYKTKISDVGIKLVKPDGWSMGEIKVANTVINQWEELTFDFSSKFSAGYDQIVVFPDFIARTADDIIYFDNITFSAQGTTPPPAGDEGPTSAATTPTEPADSVVSVFSDAYTDVTVSAWSTDWDNTNVQDTTVQSDNVKLYTDMVFAGIEFSADASSTNRFHMDIWTPDAVDAGQVFKVKLVDFGADGAYAGGDDVEHELTFSATSTPALASGSWVALDVPLSDFAGLTTTAHISQMILSGDLSTVWLDNVYFYAGETQVIDPDPAPTLPAAAPTAHADSVISLYSDVYTDLQGVTWSTDWDNTTLTDTTAGGNPTKLYTNSVFVGIEFTADASDMTHFHMDVWTPDATDGGQVFKVKLVDFGADGAYGGGDDVEHELVLNASSTPAIGSEQWLALDMPLSDFTGLTTKGHVSQLIISGDLSTYWVDNVYFRNDGEETPPVVSAPTLPAAAPTAHADSVISLYSDVYTDLQGVTWSTDWDNTTLTDTTAGGNPTKLYTNSVFVGIEFTADASDMTHFHMDVWTPDATDGGQVFKVKLVDFGADGAYGGGDDVEHELVLNASSTPAIGSEQWLALDMPLSDFTGLTTKGHVSQLIISGDLSTYWVDNVYFRNDGEVTPPPTGDAPTAAAPTPDEPAANVVSLYSDPYTNVPVTTWSAAWDVADVVDTTVAGDANKLYTGVTFAGIEFTSPTVDASAMEYFHMDLWTPETIESTDVFKIKLVDFGADGVWSGGGDDVEHELIFTSTSTPALVTGSWISFDIPLTDFTNLTTTGHMAQLILAGNISKFYLDNVYFYKTGSAASEPTVAATTPTAPANEVVSIFSDAYTDVPVSTFSTDWDWASVEDVVIASDNVKKYTSTGFAGIEFTANATDQTHFHMDVWTPDDVTGKTFKIKLVDYGNDGAFDGGDDSEHELSFTPGSTPGIASGTWVAIDIPMEYFSGLTSKAHLSQMILSGELGTYYIDNIYFYIGDSQVPEPEVAATTPTHEAAKVISLFSNAYTNVTVDTWSADWDAAEVEDVQIASDDVKKYTGLSFAGIEFSSQTIDATNMEYFHMDIWTPDATALPAVFKIKLVDFGPNGVYEEGGDNTEHEITLDASTTPALASEQWVSINIPLSDFTGLTTKAHLAQLIISGDPNIVYVDNVYFYTTQTSIDDVVPTEFALAQNYPNPFNPTTTIAFNIPEANHVTLTLYNMLGQEIATLLSEYKDAGSFEYTLDAADLPTGTYLYAITAGDYRAVKKMVLMK